MQTECLANEAFLKVVFTTIVRNTLQKENVDTEYLEVDTVAYIDDGEEKIALFVAFLQDFSKANSKLDEIVLNELISEVKEKNLTEVVDDINVNLWQWKNGKAAFSLLWEE